MEYTVNLVSVRCDGEIEEKRRYPSVDAAMATVERGLQGISSYWRYYVLDQNGNKLWRGTRRGFNATGNGWKRERKRNAQDCAAR